MNDICFLAPDEMIGHHSKSFALAARLLPAELRADVVALYAWCRTCDDAVDRPAPGSVASESLQVLRANLSDSYAGKDMPNPVWACFQAVVRRRGIPVEYPTDLLRGLTMDVDGFRYATADDLLLYCYRVAGTVGLMLCHVLGVSHDRALPHAAHLGMAMQLTNIARDVREDASRGRCYLPADWVGAVADPAGLGRTATVPAVRQLLALANLYYRSGDAGLCYLAPPCRRAIRAARSIYAAIGDRVAAQGCDIDAGRAVVPGWRKLALVFLALADPLGRWQTHALTTRPPTTVWHYQPSDIVPGGSNLQTERPMNNNPLNHCHSWYQAIVGLALTAGLATLLFVMVMLIPKSETYDVLPQIYATACLTGTVVLSGIAWLLNRRSRSHDNGEESLT